MAMALLFTVLAVGLGAIAVAAMFGSAWVVAVGAGAIAAWLVSLAFGAVRRSSR